MTKDKRVVVDHGTSSRDKLVRCPALFLHLSAVHKTRLLLFHVLHVSLKADEFEP